MANLKIEKTLTGVTKYEDKNGNGKIDSGEIVGSIMYAQGNDGKVKGVKINNVSVFNPKEISDDLAGRGDVSSEASNETLPVDEKGNFKIQNGKEYSVNAFKTALTKMTKPEVKTTSASTPDVNIERSGKPTISFDAIGYQNLIERGQEYTTTLSQATLMTGSGDLYQQTMNNYMNDVYNKIRDLYKAVNDKYTTKVPGAVTTSTTTEPTPVFVEDKTPIKEEVPAHVESKKAEQAATTSVATTQAKAVTNSAHKKHKHKFIKKTAHKPACEVIEPIIKKPDKNSNQKAVVSPVVSQAPVAVNNINKEIDRLRNELKELDKKRAIGVDVAMLKDVVNSKIDNYQKQLKNVPTKINSNKEEIASLKKKVEQLKADNKGNIFNPAASSAIRVMQAKIDRLTKELKDLGVAV